MSVHKKVPLKQDLTKFFYARQDSAFEQLSKENKKERSMLLERQTEIMNKVKDCLGEDLFFELDGIEAQLDSIENDAMYRQGFSDGMKIAGDRFIGQ